MSTQTLNDSLEVMVEGRELAIRIANQLLKKVGKHSQEVQFCNLLPIGGYEILAKHIRNNPYHYSDVIAIAGADFNNKGGAYGTTYIDNVTFNDKVNNITISYYDADMIIGMFESDAVMSCFGIRQPVVTKVSRAKKLTFQDEKFVKYTVEYTSFNQDCTIKFELYYEEGAVDLQRMG